MRFRSGIIRFGSVWHFFKHFFLFIIFNTSKVQIFCTKIYLSRATVICRDFHFLIIHSVYNICKSVFFYWKVCVFFPSLVAVAAAQSVPEILFANVMHFIAFTAFKTWLFIIFYSTKIPVKEWKINSFTPFYSSIDVLCTSHKSLGEFQRWLCQSDWRTKTKSKAVRRNLKLWIFLSQISRWIHSNSVVYIIQER